MGRLPRAGTGTALATRIGEETVSDFLGGVVCLAISAKGTSELLSQPLVAKESEVIKVTAATANRLHVVLSALEIKPREVT